MSRKQWGHGYHAGKAASEKNGLVGLFCLTFHTDKESEYFGLLKYQCHVVSDLGNGFYLVQIYDTFGDASDMQVAHLEDMRQGGWVFYHTQQAWHSGYEEYSKRSQRAERETDSSGRLNTLISSRE
jgi:hypothetical protein